MDPRRSAQEVLLCDLCDTDPLQSHCELCHINLCIACVGKHISDPSGKHRVIPFTDILSSAPDYPKCRKHPVKQCELYCEECDSPVCSTCISSGQHEGHRKLDILESLSSQKVSIRNDLEELETLIFPQYEKMADGVQTENAMLETNYRKLISEADQQGNVWHQEVSAIVEERKSDIDEMKRKHIIALNKQSDEISENIAEIKQIILNLNAILKSNDVSLTSTYKSRNDEFRKLPPKLTVTLPTLSSPTINTEKLREMFGSLTPLSITTEENGDTLKSPEVLSSTDKSLHDEPQVIATINTGYKGVFSVACPNNKDEIWALGDENILKLIDLQGELLASIQTESGKEPRDIAMMRNGHLVYTDPYNRTVNRMKYKQLRAVITLHKWTPLYVCSTSSDDLLVSMISDNETEYKVVRYSGSTKIQTIQFDDQRRPLYSSNGDIKYISENRNLDICVADSIASAVVVVNQSGILRFRYTGHPSNTKAPFCPRGITTDSQGHILIADYSNHRIHIIDQNGQFRRYIQNCGLRFPLGLCVDIEDNLFVAEHRDARVKKIKFS